MVKPYSNRATGPTIDLIRQSVGELHPSDRRETARRQRHAILIAREQSNRFKIANGNVFVATIAEELNIPHARILKGTAFAQLFPAIADVAFVTIARLQDDGLGKAAKAQAVRDLVVGLTLRTPDAFNVDRTKLFVDIVERSGVDCVPMPDSTNRLKCRIDRTHLTAVLPANRPEYEDIVWPRSPYNRRRDILLPAEGLQRTLDSLFPAE